MGGKYVMLQTNTLNTIKKTNEEPEVIPRWKYKKNSFPNGASSYWIRWKLYPDDAKFFSYPKTLVIKFDKELSHLNNENISALNEWRVTRNSYQQHLGCICDELNFFETMYDKDGELIAALFRIKYLIDVDSLSYTMKNIDAFKDMCYKTIFTPSLKSKITRMIDENYADDIEEENLKNMNDPSLLSIMQRKKKSLEFKNEHVKALLEVSFGVKILSFIINHFCVMRSINIQKNLDIFYRFYLDMFYVFKHDFDIFNKIYA